MLGAPLGSAEPDDPTDLLRAQATYDPVGNLTKVRYATTAIGDSGELADWATEYLTGESADVEDAQWTQTTYTYNAVNLVTSVTEPGETPQDEALTTTFDYDDNYRRKQTTYPNGVVSAIDYDDSGRQTRIITTRPGDGLLDPGGVVAEYTYSYGDASGNDTALRQEVTTETGQRTDYEYDELNRLTAATITNPDGDRPTDYRYTYDANSNLLHQSVDGTDSYLEYDADNQLCWRHEASSRPSNGCDTAPAGAQTFDYDANGNLIADSEQTYHYNAADQLTGITRGDETRSYQYQDLGNDHRFAIDDTYLFEGFLGLTRSFDDSNDDLSTTQYTRDANGNLLTLRAPKTPGADAGIAADTYHYLYDGLGSVIGLTDSDGNLVTTYDYDPYGKQLPDSSPLDPALAPDNPWRYVSGYHENLTGLTKFGYRYYSPTHTRWTQPDPLFNSLVQNVTPNRYTYANCNPTNQVDSNGLSPVLIGSGCFASGLILGSFFPVVGFAVGCIGFVTAWYTGLWFVSNYG